MKDRLLPCLIPSIQSNNNNNRKFTENSEVYGQEILESTLKTQFGQYHSTLVLDKCYDYHNWNAMATVTLPKKIEIS
jgi:hypothetical protein